MPKFNVTSPDGTTYSVNAPEGATEDDAIAYIQREHYQAKNPSDVIQPSAGIGERIGNGLCQPDQASGLKLPERTARAAHPARWCRPAGRYPPDNPGARR